MNQYEIAMAHPKSTKNNDVFRALYDSVSDEDVKKGSNRMTFAYAHLIEWAIRHKKYVPYYEFIGRYKDTDQHDIIKMLELEKYVVVTFNYVAEPRFGFIRDGDDLCIISPTKSGMQGYFL